MDRGLASADVAAALTFRYNYGFSEHPPHFLPTGKLWVVSTVANNPQYLFNHAAVERGWMPSDCGWRDYPLPRADVPIVLIFYHH